MGRCQRCIRLDYHNINSNPGAESCPHCEQFTLPRHLHEHHISYDPEETMTVCASCHGAIHAEKVDDDLEPELTREEWLECR